MAVFWFVYAEATFRFLNLCARHEIMFWKIQPDSPTQVSFYIRLQDLYELRPYLRKTKTRIHIRKRIGFPFFWQKYRARKLGIFVLCVSWQESGCSVRESGELKSKGILSGRRRHSGIFKCTQRYLWHAGKGNRQ